MIPWWPTVVAALFGLLGLLAALWSRTRRRADKLEHRAETAERNETVYREGQAAAAETARREGKAADAAAEAHDRVVGALEQDARAGDGAAVDRLLELAGGVREDAPGVRPDPGGGAEVPAKPAPAAPHVPVRGRR